MSKRADFNREVSIYTGPTATPADTLRDTGPCRLVPQRIIARAIVPFIEADAYLTEAFLEPNGPLVTSADGIYTVDYGKSDRVTIADTAVDLYSVVYLERFLHNDPYWRLTLASIPFPPPPPPATCPLPIPVVVGGPGVSLGDLPDGWPGFIDVTVGKWVRLDATANPNFFSWVTYTQTGGFANIAVIFDTSMANDCTSFITYGGFVTGGCQKMIISGSVVKVQFTRGAGSGPVDISNVQLLFSGGPC